MSCNPERTRAPPSRLAPNPHKGGCRARAKSEGGGIHHPGELTERTHTPTERMDRKTSGPLPSAPATPRMLLLMSPLVKNLWLEVDKNTLLPPATLAPPPPASSPKHKHKTTPPLAQPQVGAKAARLGQQQFQRKSIGDWDFVRTIGAGSMGKVKLAKHLVTNEMCAVKIVPRAEKLYLRAHANDPPPKTEEEAAARRKEFDKECARDRRTIREAALGRLLYHPNVCRLYLMMPMTNHYYMIFEYVDGGQLLDYIVSHRLLKENFARKLARGIGLALEYCHRNNVVHRDLKIENIMIDPQGEIKIIDFGLLNLYSPNLRLKTYCGLLYFAAPELLSAKPYVGPEVDIWSFGVVIYVLVVGKVPFDDPVVPTLHEKIKQGHIEYPLFILRECVLLLQRMLVVDPTKRATMQEVLLHPWMRKGYEHPVPIYLPKRVPLTLPLDPDIIKMIASLDLGQPQALVDELTAIILSNEYQAALEAWHRYKSHGRSLPDHVMDPTAGFHPLVSIYYLVEEVARRSRGARDREREREKEKERERDKEEREKLQPDPFGLPLPRPQEPLDGRRVQIAPQRHPSQNAGRAPEADKLVQAPVQLQVPAAAQEPKEYVRRGVSMKVTAKEKLSSLRISLPKDKPKTLDPKPKPGFVPVEYLPPLPNINVKETKPEKRFHPTARARSVGGHVRKNLLGGRPTPALPNAMAAQNSDDRLAEAYDDVTLDDGDVPKLTEEQIVQQFQHARRNSMPSIEYPKTLFLKGFFSVQTTSTKPLPVIRYNIILVLTTLGVRYREVKGGFVCTHHPLVRSDTPDASTIIDEYRLDTLEERRLYGDAFRALLDLLHDDVKLPRRPLRQPLLLTTPKGHRLLNSTSSLHRRKFSIGQLILGHYRKRDGLQTLVPPSTPAAARLNKVLDDDDDHHTDESTDSLLGIVVGGGSDMLVLLRIEHRARHGRSQSASLGDDAELEAPKTPLKFEINIVKVPLVGLFGVQFKKTLGNTWNYKTLAGQILSELNL